MRWLVWFLASLGLVVVPTVFCAVSLNPGDFCQTESKTNGTCEPVRNCSYVRKMMENPDVSFLHTEYVSTLNCGEMMVPQRKRPIPLLCCPKFENNPTCGAVTVAGRIFGGMETPLGEHPWAALLFYDIGRNRTAPRCGGSLVSERYVITAAHCIVDRPNWTLLYVRFSEFNISSKTNCTMTDNGEVCRNDYEVESITPHPEYNKTVNSRPNDICILRLATDVTFTDYVRPICLPFEPESHIHSILDEYFTVTGWGETEDAPRSNVQKHVDQLPGLENESCNTVYKVANVTLTEKQLCVGGLNGSDSCRGDSGGPLLRQVVGVWYLAGVVSFGARNCGTKDLPGVYTNVVKYLDWMEKVMFLDRFL